MQRLEAIRLDDKARRALAQRKDLHAQMQGFISYKGGWLTSIPGDKIMRFEAVPDSTLPGDLQALGFKVSKVGSTTRIIPAGTTEVIAGEHSSSPPCRVIQHAGIVQTNVYELMEPPHGL